MKIIILLFVIITFCCSFLNATIINIPADQSTIQAGINAAVNVDTVLVQPGTYVENINYNGKNITVASLFLTTQDTSYISQTIIDGSQNGSVVTFESGEDSTSVLIGFTVTNGNASRGGGIYCVGSSSPTLMYVTITENSASWGGGIICDNNSNPKILNVIISDNYANTSGGGICIFSDAIIFDSIISNNNAHRGGGIHCQSGSNVPEIINVTINNNTAYSKGGGVCIYFSNLKITNSIISNNNGNYGIYVESGSPSITYSDFYNNENGNFYNCGQWIGVNVTTNANGDSCDVYYNIQMEPCFVDTANGDYHITENSPCIDAGDPSSPPDPDGTVADMGAYYFEQSQINANFEADVILGEPPLTVNFADLSTPRDSIISWYWDFGDGIDTTYTSYIDTITHIYQGIGTYDVSLTVTDINDSTDTELKIDYITIYEGNEVNGHAYLYNQANHIGIKILFERFAPSIYKDSTYTSEDGYYSIGLPDGIYDIKYLKDNYYSQTLNEPIYSNTTLQEITLYTYIIIPLNYPTIQEGINNCIDGDTILVQPGTYVENINYNGKNITVASLFYTTQDTSYISQTVIDGDSLDSVVTFESEEDSTAVLTGFTITNGQGYGSYPDNTGGGITCNNSSPSLENLTISGNSAVDDGGGICCVYNSSPSLENLTISGNSAVDDGGGIYCWDNSSPSLENVKITGNSAGYGGGICCYSSSSIFKNVIISYNSAGYIGGGIRCHSSSLIFKNVIISYNSATYYGGGICLFASSPSLENVTITSNSASYDGGGIYCDNSSPSLVNSIVSDNTGNFSANGIYVHSGNPTIIYSDFYNNEGGNFHNCSPGIGCIEADPLFVDPANGDYHLSWANFPIPDSTMSPCIDAGDPSFPLDPDGTIADMGAFYYAQGFNANFKADKTSGYLQLTINFTDLSTPRDSITSWYWDFGDGMDTTYTSYIDTITHFYQDVGTYDVSLSVTDINDSTDTELKIDYITIYEGNEVNGHAYLYNQANPIGIKILFERFAPSIYKDSTYTSADGYYSIGLPDGIYNITYLKDNYYSQTLNEPIYSNTALQEITLYTYIIIPLNYPTIQEGINHCLEGDTVLVDIGNYLENIDFNGKSITVASKYLITQDTSYISQTIIDGNQNGSVVTFENGEDSTAFLTGFTVKNGNISFGGGIYCNNSSPTIKHVTITGNSAADDGGGIYCCNSTPSLENVTITGNSAENDGGGIYCSSSSSPTIINSIVSDNIGDYGIYVDSGNPSITYSDFYNNENGNFYNCGQWVGVNVTTNANGDSCDAYFNIQLDPLFEDPANGGYHLTENSPCIDAGDPSSPLDPDGTVADMGAFYYNQNIGVDEPEEFTDYQVSNYPNPFNGFTRISYSLLKPSNVKIDIFNIKGQLVETLVDKDKPAGYHTIEWNAKGLNSGIYFYKFEAEGKTLIKKMILIR